MTLSGLLGERGSPRWTITRGLAAAVFCGVVGSIALTWLGLRASGRTTDEFARWPFIDMWIRWDAGWYQAIATAGYYFSPTEQSAVAYFPVYPALMRLVCFTGANPYLAGIFVTLVCGLAGLVVFRRWSVAMTDGATADRAVVLIAIWPFAYYLYGAVYSDALFLLLVVGAFLCIERDRPWTAALLGAVATATRPVAPAVVIGLLVRHLELRRRAGQRWTLRDGVPALSGLGLVAYMTYLYVRFGDPLAFVTTQAGWAQAPGSSWLGKFSLTAGELASHQPSDAALPLFHLALALGMLALGWRAWKKLGKGYAVYVWVVLLIPMSATRDFISLGRYSLAAFPSFLMLSDFLGTRTPVRRAWMAVSVVMLAWMVSRFALGRYVA